MPLAPDIDTVQFGAILKTALDAVVVMREDGTVAGWNDVAARTFGWTFAEVKGRRMSELIIPERYRQAHEDGLARLLATGEGRVLDRHIDIEAIHRSGRELPVELSITRATEFGEPVFLGFLRDISERREHERRQAMLVAELNHRVKNLLGVVGAVAHQTARSSASLDAFTPAFTGRLESLGRAHEILTAATWDRAPLRPLAEAVLGSFIGTGDACATVIGLEVTLSPRQFLSVSMILHELTTNALKYGALASPEGRVALRWEIERERLTLSWRETGPGPVAAPAREGFGSRMIALNVRHDLRGTAESRWLPAGLEFILAFALD
ncbi:MAG: sensor histidine kinase [Sphingomicrobium sp.]|nr:PAS domain S-box protein [Sphingomonadales bacterium]